MNEQKPTSVKIVGIIISIISGFLILSNLMGALFYLIFNFNEGTNCQTIENQNIGESIISYLLGHFIVIYLICIITGIILLIGGLNMIRFKQWTNKLIKFTSGILILLIWIIMLSISQMNGSQENADLFVIIPILIAFVLSVPFGLLIWFLSRKKIKKHFV